MPVTAGTRKKEISQRAQYALGGIGRRYWDYRDRIALRYVLGPRMLDTGCGEGITLEKLVDRFPEAEVQGIDVDFTNVEICRKHGLPAKQGDIYDLPFGESEFDTCICMEVIEHLERPERAVAEMARVTRTGGRLVIVYPIDWAMWMARIMCLRFREARFDPGHVRQWNRRDVEHLLKESGYHPVAFRGIPLPLPFMLHGVIVGAKVKSGV